MELHGEKVPSVTFAGIQKVKIVKSNVSMSRWLHVVQNNKLE
jgi:hypothetical protein